MQVEKSGMPDLTICRLYPNPETLLCQELERPYTQARSASANSTASDRNNRIVFSGTVRQPSIAGLATEAGDGSASASAVRLAIDHQASLDELTP